MNQKPTGWRATWPTRPPRRPRGAAADGASVASMSAPTRAGPPSRGRGRAAVGAVERPADEEEHDCRRQGDPGIQGEVVRRRNAGERVLQRGPLEDGVRLLV